MFKFNIKDVLWLSGIVIAAMVILIGVSYLEVDSSETIDIPSRDTNPSMSPTGAMSGTIG